MSEHYERDENGMIKRDRHGFPYGCSTVDESNEKMPLGKDDSVYAKFEPMYPVPSMDDRLVRFECLKLALNDCSAVQDVIAWAGRLSEFVINGEQAEAKKAAK